MRISTNFIYNSTRRTMQESISNLLKVQEVMASQRKVNQLSDDPVAVGRIMNTDRMIAQHNQFVRNLDQAQTVSNLYDESCNSTMSLLSRAKQLLLGETNSASSTEMTREAARAEIVSLASQLVNIANMQYGGRFLYGGYADNTAPFLDALATTVPNAANTGTASATYQSIATPTLVTGDAYEVVFTAPGVFDVMNTTTGTPVLTGQAYTSGASIQFGGITLQLTGVPAAGDRFAVTTTPAGTYVGDSGIVNLEVEQDVLEQVNLTGDMVFHGVGTPEGIDLFSIFERANEALRTNDQTQLNALLEEFDSGMQQATRIQSVVGAREDLFKSTQERLKDVTTNLETLLSDLRDVDIAQAITDLNRQENAYQAVLAAVSKTVQPNLLDFLS